MYYFLDTLDVNSLTYIYIYIYMLAFTVLLWFLRFLVLCFIYYANVDLMHDLPMHLLMCLIVVEYVDM